MTNMEARISALEDIEQIRQLKAAYCEACDDDHNGDAVAQLFIPDGVWQRSGDRPHEGHDEIAAQMFGIRDRQFMVRSSHMVTNPVIDIDGDEAAGHWKFVMLYTGTDGAFTRIIGRYTDRYTRYEGEWRFRSLFAQVDERGVYRAEPS
jgi:uncharacterized protein (TIGR02246 family)